MKEIETRTNTLMLNYFNKKGSDSVPVLHDEPGRKKYVEWGVKDSMPYRLLELYNNSGFHRAIIDSRVNMIVGNGLVAEGVISQRTEDFLKRTNSDENLDMIYKKLAFDYEIFGIAYIEVIYSADRLSIVEINHIDATKIRWGHKNMNKLTHFYYSDNWRKVNKNPPVLIPKFNPTIKQEHPRQILPIIRYTPAVDYYTLPSYYSVIKWISVDYEISNFHEKNIQNGFAPTMYFGFPHGIPTEEEREMTDRKLQAKYGGTDNAGGIITAYYEPGSDNKVDVQVLDITDAGDQYEWLANKTQQEILIGHKVTNENLVGISTPGKLGSSSELLQSHELYYNNVIKHEQDDIINQINKLMAYNGMNDVEVMNDKPLSQEFSETILKEILTTEELREIIGYEPLEVVEEKEAIEENTELSACNCKDHKFEASTEHIFGQVDNKELESGDEIEVNGKKYTLSQTVIDGTTGINADANDKDLYTWTLGPGGLSKENCPICKSYAGQIRQLRRWKKVAIPATSATKFGGEYPHGPYGTFCEEHCSCKLIKIN